MRKQGLTIVCASVLAVFAATATAQEKKGNNPPPPAKEAAAGADDMAKMMEAFAKLAAPGPQHEQLKAMAGSWTVAGKFRMDPSQPWEESKSESQGEMILGGRFLQQHFTGEPMMGMPTKFEGLGFMGFDNQKQKFVSTWMDNMGTMIMVGEGSYDAAAKTLTMRSDYIDPMTNQKSFMRSVYKMESADKYVLTAFGPAPDGKEFQMMELVHTKKK